MRITSPASVRRLRKAIIEQRPDPSRRDDSGLTTLEWLLIVAAVAGLAALAVVLVTNVVSDTSDQISGQSARVTAAKVAAQRIEDDTANLNDEEAKKRCERLPIIYDDVISAAAFAGTGNARTCTVTERG